jgi:hypothetical protein
MQELDRLRTIDFARFFAVEATSELGQSRRVDRAPLNSGLRRSEDISSDRRHRKGANS